MSCPVWRVFLRHKKFFCSPGLGLPGTLTCQWRHCQAWNFAYCFNDDLTKGKSSARMECIKIFVKNIHHTWEQFWYTCIPKSRIFHYYLFDVLWRNCSFIDPIESEVSKKPAVLAIGMKLIIQIATCVLYPHASSSTIILVISIALSWRCNC